jgi:hypothetical protein
MAIRQKDSKKLKCLVFFFFVFTFDLFAQQLASPVKHTIFFVGDAGEPDAHAGHLGKVLRRHITDAGSSTVLFLGDNVYPAGLPDRDSRFRIEAEKILQNQVDWIKGLDAKAIFIPGNHDWNHWGKDGLQYLANQQQWIDSLKDENFIFLPKEGCPGPVEVAIGDKILLAVLDTQWFLHQYDKPGEDGPCDAKTVEEVMALLEDIFLRNAGKRIIVIGHHPIITYGIHGGKLTWKNHLFPLSELHPPVYVPAPIVGSVYALYRKVFGHIQDTAHPLYKEFREPIEALLESYPGSIYVAGHEHALQYIVKDSTHFIVSGSAAKTNDVKQKGFARFAKAVRGFAKLSIHQTGEITIHFIQADDQSPEGKEIFTVALPASNTLQNADQQKALDFSNSFVRVKASDRYDAGPWRKKMLGENYRREWLQELEIPVFDIGKEKGGLKILQKGGGQQTLSLRLEDSTGHEYVLRSVEKYPEKAIPEVFRKTFAQDLVQDQISAAHPYAALVIPPLAKAAGIYHTNPKLVYIPDDPRLNEYRRTFGNTIALFEERPAGDWSEAAFFGNSGKIINTSKVLEQLKKDNDNAVDQKFVLRSRLFDLVIGDWDRHDDQWRWASFKDKKTTLFRPIPRDRDQAFFVNEGILSKLWSRKWALPKFEGFDEEINWPSGFSFNARYFDRSFLNRLSEDQWISAAKQLQDSLTDEVIESAVGQWPEEIYQLSGKTIIDKLKARRNKLQVYALEHYKFLSREADVTGSDKREQFTAERLANGDTHVMVFKISKEGKKEKKIYDRVFSNEETKEIRLYGLDGDDKFLVSGNAAKAIRLRIIGGEGQDFLSDSSHIPGLSRKTIFYDQTGQFELGKEKEVKNMTSSNAKINEYSRTSFKYNRFAPLLYGNYNPDDGLFIGGGFINIVHGYRKEPFKQRHLFLGSIAPLTQSFNFRYQGKFTEVIGKLSVEVDANLKSPNYVNNFFGMGNESIYNQDIDDDPAVLVDESIDYYRYRFEEMRLEASVSRSFGNSAWLKLGPAFQGIEMEESTPGKDRFIEQYAASLDHDIVNEYSTFLGAAWELGIDRRNEQRFPRRGFLWNVTGRNMTGIDKSSTTFSSYESSLSLYHSFTPASRWVFAARAGAGLNTGKYEFYQAQVLDGKNELRGFRKTRFYGDRKFYSNFEIRLKLLNFRSYLFPASLGIVGFHDLGRVWYKDENGMDASTLSGESHVWHKGWGGGLWFTPFNLTVLSAEIAHSEEGNLVYVRLGFMF